MCSKFLKRLQNSINFLPPLIIDFLKFQKTFTLIHTTIIIDLYLYMILLLQLNLLWRLHKTQFLHLLFRTNKGTHPPIIITCYIRQTILTFNQLTHHSIRCYLGSIQNLLMPLPIMIHQCFCTLKSTHIIHLFIFFLEIIGPHQS